MKKRVIRTRCPNCGSCVHNVVSTHHLDDGRRVRRRHCPGCDHRFYTEQSMEIAIDPARVSWVRDKDRHSKPFLIDPQTTPATEAKR